MGMKSYECGHLVNADNKAAAVRAAGAWVDRDVGCNSNVRWNSSVWCDIYVIIQRHKQINTTLYY